LIRQLPNNCKLSKYLVVDTKKGTVVTKLKSRGQRVVNCPCGKEDGEDHFGQRAGTSDARGCMATKEAER
jgi:hypothetical protein